jgi:hypothetical protein
MPSLCRDCLTLTDAAPSRCPSCRSPRIVAHVELAQLSIAHMDCDAFYASVEKRDNPALRDQAVIVGGGQRGVVLFSHAPSRASVFSGGSARWRGSFGRMRTGGRPFEELLVSAAQRLRVIHQHPARFVFRAGLPRR